MNKSRQPAEATSAATAAFRQRAEQRALEPPVQTPDSLAAMTPEEVRRTLHELRVYQIQLEMQN